MYFNFPALYLLHVLAVACFLNDLFAFSNYFGPTNLLPQFGGGPQNCRSILLVSKSRGEVLRNAPAGKLFSQLQNLIFFWYLWLWTVAQRLTILILAFSRFSEVPRNFFLASGGPLCGKTCPGFSLGTSLADLLGKSWSFFWKPSRMCPYGNIF